MWRVTRQGTYVSIIIPAGGGSMVISILMRRSAITDSAEWRRRVAEAQPRVQALLQRQPGFIDLQYAWGVDDNGEMSAITRWRGRDDCRGFVRGGAAAMMATIEDAIIPTAAYPMGAWVRRTYEVDG